MSGRDPPEQVGVDVRLLAIEQRAICGQRKPDAQLGCGTIKRKSRLVAKMVIAIAKQPIAAQ